MSKYTTQEFWRTPRPYILFAVLFAVITGICYVARFSSALDFVLGWYLALDSQLTAKEAAVALALMAVFAASPSLRAGMIRIATLLAPPAKKIWDANKDGIPTEVTWSLLGGLRFYLAFVVICTHLEHWCGSEAWLKPITSMNATCAVMIFLTISGFSMGQSLHAKPHGFYVRRLKRLYPVYITGLLLSLIPFHYGNILIGPYWRVGKPDALTFLLTALFLQTWLTIGVGSALQYWSLGVEAACYAIAPILRRLPIWPVALLTAASAAVFIRYPWPEPIIKLYGVQTLLYCWAWLIGWLLYRYRATHGRFLVLAALFLIMKNTRCFPDGGYIWLPIILTLIVLVGHRIHLKAVASRFLDWLGDISYPLYCGQNAGFWLLWEITRSTASIWYILVALAFGVAIFYCVDLPWRRLMARSKNAPTGFLASTGGVTPVVAPATK